MELGRKGGAARAAKMDPERRSEIREAVGPRVAGAANGTRCTPPPGAAGG